MILIQDFEVEDDRYTIGKLSNIKLKFQIV